MLDQPRPPTTPSPKGRSCRGRGGRTVVASVTSQSTNATTSSTATTAPASFPSSLSSNAPATPATPLCVEPHDFLSATLPPQQHPPSSSAQRVVELMSQRRESQRREMHDFISCASSHIAAQQTSSSSVNTDHWDLAPPLMGINEVGSPTASAPSFMTRSAKSTTKRDMLSEDFIAPVNSSFVKQLNHRRKKREHERRGAAARKRGTQQPRDTPLCDAAANEMQEEEEAAPTKRSLSHGTQNNHSADDGRLPTSGVDDDDHDSEGEPLNTGTTITHDHSGMYQSMSLTSWPDASPSMSLSPAPSAATTFQLHHILHNSKPPCDNPLGCGAPSRDNQVLSAATGGLPCFPQDPVLSTLGPSVRVNGVARNELDNDDDEFAFDNDEDDEDDEDYEGDDPVMMMMKMFKKPKFGVAGSPSIGSPSCSLRNNGSLRAHHYVDSQDSSLSSFHPGAPLPERVQRAKMAREFQHNRAQHHYQHQHHQQALGGGRGRPQFRRKRPSTCFPIPLPANGDHHHLTAHSRRGSQNSFNSRRRSSKQRGGGLSAFSVTSSAAGSMTAFPPTPHHHNNNIPNRGEAFNDPCSVGNNSTSIGMTSLTLNTDHDVFGTCGGASTTSVAVFDEDDSYADYGTPQLKDSHSVGGLPCFGESAGTEHA